MFTTTTGAWEKYFAITRPSQTLQKFLAREQELVYSTVHALIYSFKQNTIQSWNAPLPQIENLVLNGTFTSWQDVIDLTKKIPSLTELHACENGNYVYSLSVSDHLPTSS